MSDADRIRDLDAALEDRYRIEREIGRGGMATVYLADDLKHERKVALKVLRPELAAVLGGERFLKEIQVTARLQHPGILPLFDSGEAGGFLYYVMPWIRGESLRARLDRDGALEFDEAVRIAREVALALDYAHREGVVHRDIKPENILLHEGRPLVADFGIALAVEEAGAGRLTGTGLSLGTPSYMSPEQATGEQELDSRTDVYSLGCLVYEILTGTPPHPGTNPREILARILTGEPASLGSVRPGIPEPVETAVMRALSREPADRWSSAGDFADALVSDSRTVTSGAGVGRRTMLGLVGVLGVALVAMTLVALGDRGSGSGLPAMTSTNLTSFLGREHGPNWSPDGSMLAFAHTLDGHSDIFVMSVPGGNPIRLTDHPADDDGPRWSPTGEWIAFLSDRGTGIDVMLVAPTGGRVRSVTSTDALISEYPSIWFLGLGADPWSPDGRTLLFPRRDSVGNVGVWSLDVGSGEARRLTTPPAGSQDLMASFSPDGRQIVFSRGVYGNAELWIMAADGSDARPLPDDVDFAYSPTWTPDGEELVFIGDMNLWTRSMPSGEPRPLTSGQQWIASADVGPRGQIAYSSTPHLTNLYEGLPGTPPEEHEALSRDTRDEYGTRVSRNGRTVLYQSDRNGTMDIWSYDRETGEDLPLVEGPAVDQMADRLPDGGVVFVSSRGEGSGNRLWTQPADGGEPRLFGSDLPPITCGEPYCRKGPNVSPDGQRVGFVGSGDDGAALWLVDTDGSDPAPVELSGLQSFDWYLDSRRVIYTARATDGGGQIELRARHLATGEDVLLLRRSATEPAVTVDGRAVGFLNAASHYDMNAFVLELEPPSGPEGLPRPVGEPRSIIDGQGVWHVHNLDWTPSGSVIYTRDEDSGDILVLRPEEGGR